MRKLLAFPVALALLMAMSAPVTADRPASSGAVIRLTNRAWVVFPDAINGYWVFANIDRGTYCAWFEAGGEPPPPEGFTEANFQIVITPDAEVVLIRPEVMPVWLHAFAAPDPFADPCAGSVETAELWGDLHVILNDNDLPNLGKRANSFGQHGQAKLWDADGNRWHYNFSLRIVFGPEENAPEFGIPQISEHAILKMIGNG